MLLVLFYTFLVLLFSALSSAKVMKNGLKVSFILITIYSALRYNYGPDYMNYLRSYNDLCSHYDLTTFMRDDVYSKEPGWSVLCLITSPIGFYGLVIIISIFTYYVYYKFIHDNVPVKWQWLAVANYMLNPYFYWIHMSMMRQALAVTIFVIAFKYICKKNLLVSFILVLLAFSMHRSAMFLFPFIFFGYLPIKRGRVLAIFMLVLFLLMFTLTPIILEYVLSNLLDNPIVADYVYSYGTEEWAGAEKFSIGGVIFLIPLLFFAYYIMKSNSDDYNKYITLISCAHFMILPLSMINGLFGRMSYYFHIFFIASIPASFALVRGKIMALLLFLLYFSIVLYTFAIFFSDPSWVSFSKYQTILFN